MVNKNDLITVKITDVSFAGLGIAKHSDGDAENFVIFVHNAVPGDRLVCRVVKTEKKFAYGIIDKLLEPSEKRREPECKTFEKCGGCVFLNMDYKAELEIKREFVRNALKRYLTVFPEPEETVPSPVTENYRNKVVCPLSANGKFGFYARASHRNIENNNCFMQDSAFAPLLAAAEKYINKMKITPYDETAGKGLFRQLYLRRAQTTGEIFACAVINGENLPDENLFAEEMEKAGAVSVAVNVNKTRGNTVLGDKFRIIRGKSQIEDELCGLRFKISPQSFYQINSRQAERLYTRAIALADPKKTDVLLDLYCGMGAMALVAAEYAGEVIGIETVPEAVSAAKENAAVNGIKNAKFFAATAANTSEILEKEKIAPTVVIVDPPRKGLDEETIGAIKKIAPKRLVYVSCNPETLARDLKILTNQTKSIRPDSDENSDETANEFSAKIDETVYEIEKITPFDMFPRTQHVECVVGLQRIEK